MLTRFPVLFSWFMIESSSIDTAPKLALMSIKVGNEPVVIPFIRCIVVVGGSE